MQELFGRAVRLGVRASAIALSALILASCGAGSDEVATPPLFSTTVVFGASLTDTGNVCPAAANCPPSPPYASGRYSDGTLFIETVAGRYGAALVPSLRGGNNFAYAGARTGAIPGLTTQSATPSMVQQVDQFLTRQASLGTLSNRALFVVDATTFGNNIATVLNTPGLNGTAVVTQGVTDIVTLITRLYSAGARHILVVNS
ncbi:MAG: SGNH/GDSL hydrolase family protein, partial [Betaproteobacteria bacterium]